MAENKQLLTENRLLRLQIKSYQEHLSHLQDQNEIYKLEIERLEEQLMKSTCNIDIPR